MPREELPRFIVPMLARTGPVPNGDGWAVEVKFDGMRLQLRRDGRAVCLRPDPAGLYRIDRRRPRAPDGHQNPRRVLRASFGRLSAKADPHSLRAMSASSAEWSLKPASRQAWW
jgi:hypothetical protein